MTKPDNPLEMNFCRRCGAKLTIAGGDKYTCVKGHEIFANSCPCVGIFFVTKDNHILVSVRGIEPHKGMLDSFGGFLQADETFEQGAIRELEEELSLTADDYEEFKYICNTVDPYPFKAETLPLVSVSFWTRLKTDKPLKPSDDVAEIRSIPLDKVNFDEFHAEGLKIAIKKLQHLMLGIQ